MRCFHEDQEKGLITYEYRRCQHRGLSITFSIIRCITDQHRKNNPTFPWACRLWVRTKCSIDDTLNKTFPFKKYYRIWPSLGDGLFSDSFVKTTYDTFLFLFQSFRTLFYPELRTMYPTNNSTHSMLPGGAAVCNTVKYWSDSALQATPCFNHRVGSHKTIKNTKLPDCTTVRYHATRTVYFYRQCLTKYFEVVIQYFVLY